jgi:hypothetical protein
VQHRLLDPEPKPKLVTPGAQDPGLDIVPKAEETKPEQQLSIGFDVLR